ncbi:MAG TPA: hypothetical protein VEG39_17475 [Clostridia bacterium]|nr:hypothetical protein [Clostridia bacterium]
MIDKKKILGAVLAGVLTVAGATSAFAAEPTANQPIVKQKPFIKFDKSELTDKVKAAINGLVSAGTITQAQADAVVKEYTPGEGRKMLAIQSISPMSELVKAGTITQAQADAVNKAVKEGIAEEKALEDIFKGLVADGTVTEAQKDAIQKVFPQKGIFVKPALKNSFSLDKLVEAGTITQAQADAFSESMKTARAARKSSADVLKDLVAAGTITQAQADAFDSALKAIREAKKSPEEVLKDLVSAGTITQEQADAMQKTVPPFGNKFSSRGLKGNSLEELVKAGTITQAQADAINAAIKEALSSSGSKLSTDKI